MEAVKGSDSNREERLTRMVEQYQSALLTLCYAYLHERELAEDAVQETFLKAYKALDSFRGECKEKNLADKHCDQCLPECTPERLVRPHEPPHHAGGHSVGGVG